MKKNSWKIRALALTLLAVCWLSGCSAHKEISVTAAETQEETRELSLNTETEAETQPEAEPEERCKKDGKIQSYLTGEWTDVAKANRRPLAIMMSNDKAALPQYGINHAGVVYEAPVEGSMNRYMALIEDYDDLDRIGSVRSCRPYTLWAEYVCTSVSGADGTFRWNQRQWGICVFPDQGSEDPAQCLCIGTKAAPGD